MTETKQQSEPHNSSVFDQFALSEVLGGDYVSSARMMKILRQVRKTGLIGEGILAAKCSERIFRPEWHVLVSKLIDLKLITAVPTGHGISKQIGLTEMGEEFLADRLGPKEPEPVAEEQLTEQATA